MGEIKVSAAKIVGGILALVGGAFILIQVLGFLPTYFVGPERTTCMVLNLEITGLAILGGISGILGKRAGGILAIIAGELAIVFGLVTVSITGTEVVWPFSFFTSSLHWFPTLFHLFAGISIEALLILGGGITIVASGSK